MWCAFERQNVVTLGNNTNNRLEASWEQLKDMVNAFMAVDECIAGILCYQHQQEKSFKNCVYNLSVVYDPKYDREMRHHAKLVSEHACELVYDDYYFAITKAKYKFHEAVPGVFLIQHESDDEDALDESHSEYSLTKSDWSCSCLFMTSRLLPSRHVFFIQKALRCENIIPTHLLNSRWLRISLRSDAEVPQFTGEPFGVSRVLKESTTCWDSSRKFREANYLTSSISEHLSGLGMREYRVAMATLREVDARFRHGEYDIITRTDSGSRELTISGELGTASGGLGSGSTELDSCLSDVRSDGIVVGTGISEMGASCDELVSNNAALVTEQHFTDEVGSRVEEQASSGNFNTQVPTLSVGGLKSEFEILSPPRSKGRPKQKSRAVKAKRKKAVAMVQEDMAMHERQRNLATIREILKGAPTYESSHECILQFKAYHFDPKPKPPIAHRTALLPPTKPVMMPKEIVRVFPMDLLNKYRAKVTAYQRKNPGTPETDIALEILGVGIFENSMLALMRQWHATTKTLKRIQRALTWIQQLDFYRHTNASFNVEKDPDLPNKLKNISILAVEKTEVLELAAKECLSDSVMQMVLRKQFGADPNVKVVDPAYLGIYNGEITTETSHFSRVLTGVTKDTKALFPINCNNNHWCAVLLDFQDGKSYIYDSMASSYLNTVRAAAQKLIMMIPGKHRPSRRMTIYDPGLGVPSDSYNCGVYVLLAFELLCGAGPLGHVNKNILQLLRYRYMRMLIEV
ncbi:hypothetical protein PPTG_13415 [Phytophthora nicotianae INRA-310]|uniref:Ubiquitin-like protease family profile domain-containing protein n=1 Tax=Phytophthora nicotianae (strain INRA-310) TaxID=761204 RepID=W2Q2Y4_PHYN3|nr:hypothetical protein PPTG_13415 [Phytophthora nicotianae INRA-310]ETN07553.1 hypothetical protein PPTG_13415 [Phytophthora nicotianae INRA-310]